MKRKYIIKCYRCGKIYEGNEISDCISKNGLKRDMKGYYCDCVKEFAEKISKKEKKVNDLQHENISEKY